MVSSSCRKLSLLEIIYSTVERLIKALAKTNIRLPENLKAYLEEGHYDDTIYRSKDKDLNSKLKIILADDLEFYSLYRGNEVIKETEEFKFLCRILKEQTQVESSIKPSKDIAPDSLQNPTDPNTTYRKKGNKKHLGYSANLVENFDDKNRIITHYDLQKNTYGDQIFTRDTIERLEKDETTLLVDGAYYSENISKQSESKNIKMVPTSLVGRSQKCGYEKFEIDEKRNMIKRCPSGHKPVYITFKKGSNRARFNKKHCNNCPLRENYPVVKQKKRDLFVVSEKKLHRSQLIIKMGTSKYQQLASKRAGIEGVPSVLRRRYNIDYLPVRRLVRSKV